MNNNGADTLIVASAVSAPLWMQEVSLLAGIIFASVGSLVGLVRLYYMIKDRKDAEMAKMNKAKFNKLRNEPVVLKEPVAEVVKPKGEAPKKRGRPKGSTNKKG